MKKLLTLSAALFLFTACDSSEQAAAPEATPSEQFNTFLDERYDLWVNRSPEWQSYLGIKDDYSKWDDSSPEAHAADLELARQTIADIQAFDFKALDAQAQISYDLYIDEMQKRLDRDVFRYHEYQVNQMFGIQSSLPAFLINIHRVTSAEDAEAYITRLATVPQKLGDAMRMMEEAQSRGILPPKFVFGHVLRDIDNVVSGRPFDDSESDSTLLADITEKVSALDLDAAQTEDLISRASDALVSAVAPAYADLRALVVAQQAAANTDDGAWKHPDGDAYYAYMLKDQTTTDLTADEVHDIGVADVARIHSEMRDIMARVEFEGSLQEFFAFMREGSQFYYPNTDEGRQAYLDKTNVLIDDMAARLPQVFATLPKAELDVKRVEAFRERSAGKAFYQSPSPDGTRPGRYYVNLYDMTSMPIYELDALAYHEALPGHHMQIAIAQELDGLPKFRRFDGATAYVEGWGLYSEYLPKEMGLYEDPYADFGRLSMELWRACRLVVDTGLHAKRWTREEAIDYLKQNTPAPEAEIVKSIERYIVMPAQATSYKIGMIKMLELRSEAEAALGEDFDIRGFHDVILRNGALPLNQLETQVRGWIEDVQGS